MPLPFRTVRSLRRRSKDNTGLNLQGPDVNRESREQISGQHRGVRRSPWMPPSPLPPLNEAEKGQWSPRALLGHKRPFYIKESWENLAGVSGLDSWPPSRGPSPAPAGFGRIRRFAPGDGLPLLPPPTPRLGVSESQVGREGLGVSPRGPPREPLKRNNVRKGHLISLTNRSQGLPREPPKRNNVRKGHRFLSLNRSFFFRKKKHQFYI